MRDLLVAKNAMVFVHDGRRVRICKGTLVRAGHPILKGREDLFEPVTVEYDVESDVEQATAAPGEKRNVRRRKPAEVEGDETQ